MDINRFVERGIDLCHRVAPEELCGQRGPVIVLDQLISERNFPTHAVNKMLGTTLH